MNVFSQSDLEISAEQVAQWLEQDSEVQLIDVRESYEHEAGHIAQARHIELERLASQADSIDREHRVVFQCRIGARSAMAAQAFRAAGFEAYSMEGGLTAWVQRGLPVEPEGGYVADH
jgi:hydroxyacylglutathione hydrolase/adenylyltransferase/sulfurtransferase